MKIWLKYLIGIVLGTALGILATTDNTFFIQSIEFLSNLSIRLGRYSLYPVLFFGFTVSIFELRENRDLLKTALFSILFTCASALLLSLIGLIAVQIYPSTRIPIFAEGVKNVQAISIAESIIRLFPSSGFEVFGNGTYILPLCIFGGFAGVGCAVDKAVSKPAVTLFYSLARVAYAVMVFFVDMFLFCMIALSAYWTVNFRTMLSKSVFTNFIMLLSFTMIFIIFIVYPIIIKLLCREENPYRILYASIAPVLAAFFSGDMHTALAVSLQHTNESMGIRRRISSVVLPVFSIFARAGSAMVITVSFAVILKSYSSLDIGYKDMIWLVIAASFFSCFLGSFPVGGTYMALASLCMLYGRGFESGYLILRPAAFFIGSAAAALNTLTGIIGTYIMAYHFKMVHKKDLRFFI